MISQNKLVQKKTKEKENAEKTRTFLSSLNGVVGAGGIAYTMCRSNICKEELVTFCVSCIRSKAFSTNGNLYSRAYVRNRNSMSRAADILLYVRCGKNYIHIQCSSLFRTSFSINFPVSQSQITVKSVMRRSVVQAAAKLQHQRAAHHPFSHRFSTAKAGCAPQLCI